MATQALKLHKIDTNTKRVGINLTANTNPEYSLDVNGSIRVFAGNLLLNNSARYPRIIFRPTNATNNGSDTFGPATIYVNTGADDAVTRNQLFFQLYSPTSSDPSNTTYTTGAEYYYLPRVDAGLTDETGYAILTSKNAITVTQGGTGSTTALGAANNILTGLPVWTADPTDSTYFIRQDASGANSFGKVTFTTLYNYIKGKTDLLYFPLAGGITTQDLGTKAWLVSDNTSSNGSGVRMRFSDKNSADYILMFASREANYGGRLIFREWSENSSGTRLDYYENFRLPRPNQGRTTNATYEILTTKGVVMTGDFLLQNDNQSPALRLKPNVSTSNGNDNYGPASILLNAGSTTAVTMNKMYFRLYSPTASSGSTTYTGYYDQYELPEADIGKTSSNSYAILTAKNTVTIAQGGTGATTRLNALKALTNESVGTDATYFLTITDSWGKGGYTSVANAKTVLGLGTAAYLNYTGTIYGSGQMGWKKVSVDMTSGRAGITSCTGATTDSIVLAQRYNTSVDATSGGYATIGAAAVSSAGTIRIWTAAGSTGSSGWSISLFWTKTATGG